MEHVPCRALKIPISSDLHQNFVFVICSGISWQWKQDKLEIVLFGFRCKELFPFSSAMNG